MTRHPKRKSRFKIKSIYLWHRYAGLGIVLFAVMLGITGVLLNHTEGFRLDSSYVQSSALLDWYGIQAPGDMESYHVADHWITQIGNRLYYDRQRVSAPTGTLIGAVEHNGLIVVAAGDEIALFTLQGELVERLSGTEGVPAGMRKIGIDSYGTLVIRGAHGDYLANLDSLSWQELPFQEANWARPKPLPESLTHQLEQEYRGTGLPWERVLLDIHSGRILGSFGVFLIDVAGVVFLLLAGTGVWTWLSRRNK